MNSTNWPAPNVLVFIAQLANAEAIGSNPVEVLQFFFRVNLQLFKLQWPLRRSYLHLKFVEFSLDKTEKSLRTSPETIPTSKRFPLCPLFSLVQAQSSLQHATLVGKLNRVLTMRIKYKPFYCWVSCPSPNNAAAEHTLVLLWGTFYQHLGVHWGFVTC